MSSIADLDALMSDLDSARRPGGMNQAGVYAPGTQVTHSFSRNESNTMSMNDTTASGSGYRQSPIEQQRHRERSEGSDSPSLISRPKSPGPQRKIQPSTQTLRGTGATAELDDLMATLNDFKVNGSDTRDSGNTGTNRRVTQQSETVTTTYSSRQQQQQQEDRGGYSPSPARDTSSYKGSRTSPGRDTSDRYDAGASSTLDRSTVRQDSSTTGTAGVDNVCAGCAKNVSGQVVTALGKVWHMECFRCGTCQTPLRTQPFFEKNGRAFCEKDYYEQFAMKCARCHAAIKDTCFTALDQTWHPECFCCARCNAPFGEHSFHEREGRPFCEQCYLKTFAPQCAGCHEPIAGTYLTALDAQWHKQCFVCHDCKGPFESGSFFDLDGRPYCELHYHANRGSVCGGCQAPISGRCITAMGKKYHPDHFVCSYCVRPLNKGTFKEHANKPWCHNCFDRLYG
ncbi:hypothetical protein RvY_14221-2 [Ramazzottius varieornatus]|nr:hypothetical protein RvY_14221-2 [Ramazzottius varieornatus]